MNKKLGKLAILSIISIVVIAGCVTAPTSFITIDKDIPQGESANIIVSSNITITEFNGDDVKNEWYRRNSRRTLNLKIPAGETQFIYNMYWQVSRGQVNSWLEGKDLTFSFNFEAGRKYTIGFYSKRAGSFLSQRHELYLAVWDVIYQDAKPERNHEKNIIKQGLVSIY